ncbi:hypothetical protein PMIN06_008438 [Paraphaeosphaeria minitans]|uniref:Uncharacterized protein n=1 Tax=Paraphaeosphaeria minitans TaxID=565426 RepID=A0A9P6GJP9_9PLEO|nr:hypothetical protein PMIN01_04205 [Paraphaeosphaeria minitans]
MPPQRTLEALHERINVTGNLRNQADRLINSDTVTEMGWLGLRAYDLQTCKDMCVLNKEHERLKLLGDLTRWYLFDSKADKARGYRMPAVKSREWEIYRQWVYTLPEMPGEDEDEGFDSSESDLPTLPTYDVSGSPSYEPPVSEPSGSDDEVDVLSDIASAPLVVLLGDPHRLVASHAVTPSHYAVEDGFIG